MKKRSFLVLFLLIILSPFIPKVSPYFHTLFIVVSLITFYRTVFSVLVSVLISEAFAVKNTHSRLPPAVGIFGLAYTGYAPFFVSATDASIFVF